MTPWQTFRPHDPATPDTSNENTDMPPRSYATADDLQRMLDFLMACRFAQPGGDYTHVGDLLSSCIGWLDPVNKIAEIEPLGTRPAFARMGLARAVVLEVLRRMRAHGMETALVYGTHANEPARQLYLSAGFEPDRTIYNYRCRL